MKIAFTVGDYVAYIHTGSPVEYETFVVELPDKNLSERLKQAIQSKDSSFVISVVKEEPKDDQ